MFLELISHMATQIDAGLEKDAHTQTDCPNLQRHCVSSLAWGSGFEFRSFIVVKLRVVP